MGLSEWVGPSMRREKREKEKDRCRHNSLYDAKAKGRERIRTDVKMIPSSSRLEEKERSHSYLPTTYLSK